MANTFSLKSLVEGNGPIYIAPILVLSSLFHIFDLTPQKHQFGQIEIIGAFLLISYYLWAQIATVLPPERLGKKRIEAVICMVVGVFSALLLLAPLLTWQYVSLYLSSDRGSFLKPVVIAILTLWIGTGVFFYGSAKYSMDKMNAAQSSMPESSMPTLQE